MMRIITKGIRTLHTFLSWNKVYVSAKLFGVMHRECGFLTFQNYQPRDLENPLEIWLDYERKANKMLACNFVIVIMDLL